MFPWEIKQQTGIQAEIREAKQLWFDAKNQFEHASGDAVIAATYRLKSIESQLDFLYKLAKVEHTA